MTSISPKIATASKAPLQAMADQPLRIVSLRATADGNQLAVLESRDKSRRVVQLIELAQPAMPGDDIPASAYAPDARARALLRGVKLTEDLLAANGGAFDLAQVQSLLRGISRQAVDKRVQDGSLLAVPGPGHGRAYPTVQFLADGGLLPGLKQVRAALPDPSPWGLFAFLVQPHADLGNRRPVDLMKSGKLDLVLAAAGRMGEQGS